MKTTLRWSLVGALATCATACAPRATLFEPAEAATAISPEGYTAAHYTLFTDVGRLGEAKVWSRGTFSAEMNGRRVTILHVGFEIENYTRTAIRLPTNEVVLDSASVNRRHLRNLPVARADGDRVVAPGTVGLVDLYFILPRAIRPHDVAAFRVRWRIRTDGITYDQRTPFLQAPERYAMVPYYYSPYYDPFYRDPFFRPRVFAVYQRPFVHVHRVPPDRVHVRRFRR